MQTARNSRVSPLTPHSPTKQHAVPGTNLRNHALEGFHDPRAFRLLIVGETAGHHDDGCQHYSQVQLFQSDVKMNDKNNSYKQAYVASKR